MRYLYTYTHIHTYIIRVTQVCITIRFVVVSIHFKSIPKKDRSTELQFTHKNCFSTFVYKQFLIIL